MSERELANRAIEAFLTRDTISDRWSKASQILRGLEELGYVKVECRMTELRDRIANLVFSLLPSTPNEYQDMHPLPRAEFIADQIIALIIKAGYVKVEPDGFTEYGTLYRWLG